MAEIVFKFNTVDKSATATIDGQEVPNVDGISCYKSSCYQNGYCLSLQTRTKDKDNDMATYTQIVASETQDGEKALKEGGKEYAIAGFVEKLLTKSETLAQDLMNFLGK